MALDYLDAALLFELVALLVVLVALAGVLAALGAVLAASLLLSLGRNLVIFVPQTGQMPLAARRPFSIVTSWASFIFRVALHFMQ
ncbi:MAG: hypothetical protein H0X37_14480 [Herpetosiphonaceae bacterium]|nr:hypothetical protein [Herpetosiphonaceae bacterium]